MIQNFTIPRYLLDDDELIALVEKCDEIILETGAAELPALVAELVAELNDRGGARYGLKDGRVVKE